MKLKIAPDSIFACEMVDAGRPAFTRWLPFVWFVWLVWLFGPLMFGDRGMEHWLWPTLVSLPTFVVLYGVAKVTSRRHASWFALAIGALAMLVSPWNAFAMTYLIYACVVAADWGDTRRSVGLIAALLLAYTAEWIVLQLPWAFLTIVWLNCLIVAGMSLYGRIQRERRAELRLSMDEVRRLAASAERERIGRDLHDLLGHTLSMVALKSELAGRLIHRDPNAAHREMADVARVSREALSQVRSAVSGIRAAAMAAELASGRLLLEAAGVQMEYWHDPHDLPGEVETCLALVLREAVTNIQRHARANRVEVTVIVGAERVVMRIRDDGRGGVNERGNGLTGMRERIAAHGGELWIESPRGKGTGIEIRLPLPQTSVGRTTTQKVVPITAASLAQPAGSRA
ncbi:MAG TPA: sensor histidine kinase [Rhodanobacteraceae bacterium]|nr:sensor histidine kinase [Rhodanobacteraceae bacterium]